MMPLTNVKYFFPLFCKNVDKESRHIPPDIRIEIKLMAWKTKRQKYNVVEAKQGPVHVKVNKPK